MNGYQSRIRANTIKLACWGAAWVAATALMKMGPKYLWDKDSPLTLLAGALNICVGIGLILAHKAYIQDLDELQQKVYMNALGITVGVILITSIPYSVMRMYNVITFDADVSHLVGLMSLTFVASILYGNWRYR